MAASVHHLAPHLYLIVLSPPIMGFQDFIGAWLVDGPAFGASPEAEGDNAGKTA